MTNRRPDTEDRIGIIIRIYMLIRIFESIQRVLLCFKIHKHMVSVR